MGVSPTDLRHDEDVGLQPGRLRVGPEGEPAAEDERLQERAGGQGLKLAEEKRSTIKRKGLEKTHM